MMVHAWTSILVRFGRTVIMSTIDLAVWTEMWVGFPGKSIQDINFPHCECDGGPGLLRRSINLKASE